MGRGSWNVPAPARRRWSRMPARVSSPACCPNRAPYSACPSVYGETLLGVLNVESREENAFAPEDVLILNTLADLLATALHNSFVFQKLQQQSITDGLTGIKTRRFFWEALSSEWKRARAPDGLLGGADRSGQIQGSERFSWPSRRRSGTSPGGPLAGSKSAASPTWSPATAETNSSSSCRRPESSRRRFWPKDCAFGSPPIPCWKSTISPAVSESPVSRFTDFPWRI